MTPERPPTAERRRKRPHDTGNGHAASPHRRMGGSQRHRAERQEATRKPSHPVVRSHKNVKFQEAQVISRVGYSRGGCGRQGHGAPEALCVSIWVLVSRGCLLCGNALGSAHFRLRYVFLYAHYFSIKRTQGKGRSERGGKAVGRRAERRVRGHRTAENPPRSLSICVWFRLCHFLAA